VEITTTQRKRVVAKRGARQVATITPSTSDAMEGVTQPTDSLASVPITASKKRSRGEAKDKPTGPYQEPTNLLDDPIYDVSMHRHADKAQERYGTSGAYHQSEHTFGYDVLARNRGRPGTGILGALEADAPAYQESKPYHRKHVGTGQHGKRETSAEGTRDIEESDRENLPVSHADRRLAILSRITARSGKYPSEEQEKTVKELVEGYHTPGVDRESLKPHGKRVLEWMRGSEGEAPVTDRGNKGDIHGFSGSAAYREAQANSIDNVQMPFTTSPKPTVAPVTKPPVSDDDMVVDPPKKYEPDRYDPNERRIGDAIQLNQLGYAFSPGFQRTSELANPIKLSAQERDAQLHAADHHFLGMALSMGTVPIVKSSSADDIKKVKKPAKKKAKTGDDDS
jgi:hypothetical protein